jgi:hypothetical protein
VSIFDEVEAVEEEAGRGIAEKAAPAAKAPTPAPEPVAEPEHNFEPDSDEALAESAGISVEALHAARAQQAAMWPESA